MLSKEIRKMANMDIRKVAEKVVESAGKNYIVILDTGGENSCKMDDLVIEGVYTNEATFEKSALKLFNKFVGNGPNDNPLDAEKVDKFDDIHEGFWEHYWVIRS